MVPSDGGFLVPETLRAELLRVSLESSIVRSRARVIPMDTLRVHFPMIDMSSNVSSVFGGMVAYWTEEAAALVQSQAKFGKIMLEAWKLTGLAKVSNELIADSLISFTALIEQLWPQALAWFEDIAFIRGTGVGEPLGFLDGGSGNNPASVSVAKETGQAADTILWENIINMYSRMLPSSLNNAVWIIAPNVFPQLATMALSVGTGGSAVWLPNGVSGPPATLLGRPVIISEKLNTLGDRGDIAFVDLSYYLIGDRQAMSTMASEHSDFANDLTAFRIIQRVTGRPWIQTAITPQYNGATLSPFVELDARA
jgi:HK97 family phage major capsid protein